MIPLRDNIPSVRRPYMAWTLIGLCALIFFLELSLDLEMRNLFFHLFGVVPRRLTDGLWGDLMGYPGRGYFTALSYMFVHGGWLHFLGNMWTMYIFADNVEDGMGHARFLGFYVLCGLGALGTHLLFNGDSTVPVVGASGAIAGVMGAYMRFYPHAKVVTLIPIIILPWIVELPAVLFLGFWFLSQLFSGAADWFARDGAQGVAWWAHVGGFVLGMYLGPLFRNPSLCEFCFHPES